MTVPSMQLNDGRSIPQLGLGVFKVPVDETRRTVEVALDAGYRHIDTASAYNNEKGVGAAVAASGIPREDLFITTKLRNGDREDPRAALESSLEQLGLDRVDLYLIHWPVPADGLAPGIWEQFEAFRAEGLASSIGVSNFRPDDLAALAERDGVTPAVNQIECHPTFQNRELADASIARGMVVEAYSPLGQGADLDAPAVREAADAHGADAGQVIIAWHLQHGRVVIPKSKTPERIRGNLAAADIELTADEMAAIDALDSGRQIGLDPAIFDWPQTGPLPPNWQPGMRP